MRKIAVMDDYLYPHHKEKIDAEAARLGFAVDYFPTAQAVLPRIGEYEILFGHSCPQVIRAAKELKWFACVYAGIDPYLDDEVWANPHCLFTNCAGAYGVAISEYVIMTLLMLLHRMPEYEALRRQRRWQRLSPIRSLYGLRLTVVGMGDTGTNVARRAAALGAVVQGVRRDPGKGGDAAFAGVHPTAALDSLLPDTDALVLCLPSTGETRGLLDRQRLALLPEGAYVVNVGRGAAADTEAIVDALNSGHLAGAALDVLAQEPPEEDSPLWTLPNLILTPHCSGDMALVHTCDRVVEMFLEDLGRYAAGQPLKYVPNRKRGY